MPAPLSVADEKRLFGKVRLTPGGCWEWTGFRNRDGYGRGKFGGRMRLIHRVTYEAFVRPLPPSVILHHEKCQNPACCNPGHVAETTRREHEDSVAGPNARLTHCRRGHPFDEANTYLDPRGHRCCRACHRAKRQRQRAARAAAR